MSSGVWAAIGTAAASLLAAVAAWIRAGVARKTAARAKDIATARTRGAPQ